MPTIIESPGVDAQTGKPAPTMLERLAGLAITPNRRLRHKVVPFGDSRKEDPYLNATQTAYNSRSDIVVAKALSGQRIIIGDSLGKSGDRTDQTWARMLGILSASNNPNLKTYDPRQTDAGIALLQCGANDIAQVATGTTFVHAVTGETVTIDTVAAVAANNILQMGRLCVAAGMEFIYENEYGTTPSINTAEKLLALMNLRSYATEMGETERGFWIHDAFGIMTNPLFSATAVQLIADLVYDGTHRNGRGAWRSGKSLWNNVLSPMIGPNPRGLLLPPRNIVQAAASRRQLLANPLLTTATGGTLAGAFTGTVPSGYGTAAVGGATAVFGTEAEPNGYGNRLKVQATFAALGNAVRYNQSFGGSGGAGAYNASLRTGDMLQAVALLNITDAPVNLCALELSLTYNTGGGASSVTSVDMGAPSVITANDQGIDEACTLVLATRPFTLPAPTGSFPFVTAELKATGMGAGSCNFNAQMGLNRRNTVY